MSASRILMVQTDYHCGPELYAYGIRYELFTLKQLRFEDQAALAIWSAVLAAWILVASRTASCQASSYLHQSRQLMSDHQP